MKNSFVSKLVFGATILGLGFLTSCKNEKAAETPAATGTTTADPATSNNKATAQLNPEHGLPGHRCDIPVGAPLNTAAGMQTTPAPTQTTTSSSTVSPIRVDKTPAVNPPHGEPGHDCAVPVGAPLK